MSSLGLTIVLYALGLALACTGVAIIGGERPFVVTGSLVVLEVAAVLQALLDLGALTRGQHGETATNLGYALVSVAILPVVASAVRLDAHRWGNVAAAMGCVLVAVVSLRLHTTLHG